jgi:myo-inositol 2-dehydrogenase/D-chiro-inositol 1-dehydrogenase
MSAELRYGIIGAGMMGVEHIENIKALDGCRVTALADPHVPTQEAAASHVDGPVEVFDDYNDMVSSGACDVLVVASPNFHHIEVLRDTLSADMPMLLEKPLCTTVEDCKEVIELAKDRSAPIWMGLEYRYMPPVARLIEIVRSGVLGTTKMISVREHRFPFLTKLGAWNRFSENTGGTLVEKTCHFWDLMTLIADATPVQVTASGGQDVNHLDEVYDGRRSDILDNAFVILEYDNGIRAMLDLCMFADATFNQEEISVVGDKGKAEALIPEDVVRLGIRGKHGFGNVEVEHTKMDAPYIGHHYGSSYVEHELFLDCIRNGTKPEIGLAEGLQSVAVGAAAHRSIDEGRPVKLSEFL